MSYAMIDGPIRSCSHNFGSVLDHQCDMCSIRPSLMDEMWVGNVHFVAPIAALNAVVKSKFSI